MKLQRRKGFSLTEIVISMSLVVMISAIGFLSCVTAIKISSRSEAETKIYNDVEKFRLSLFSAYSSVGGDISKKDAFMSSLMGDLEFYFEADGLAERISGMTGNEWEEVIPIKHAEGGSEVVYSISVRHEVTGYIITVKDSVHYTVCNVNKENFGAQIEGYRTNSNNRVYEKTISFAKEQEGEV